MLTSLRSREMRGGLLGLKQTLVVCSVPMIAFCGIYSCSTGQSNPCDRQLARCRSACLQGETRSCTALGEAYARGVEVKQSYQLAARYYEEACAYGSGDACFRLGRMFEAGQGIRRDAAAAVECYGMACVFSDGRGCFETGQAFSRCRGTPQAAELSRRFYRIACAKRDQRGCAALQKHHSALHRRRSRRRAVGPRPDHVRPGSLD
jgi:TPR repeat protein